MFSTFWVCVVCLSLQGTALQMELLGQGYTRHVDGLETSCAGTHVGTVLIFLKKRYHIIGTG